MDIRRDKVFRAYLEANRRVQAAQTAPTQYIPVTILNTFLGVVLWGDDERGQPVPLERIADNLGISPTTLSTHLSYLGERYRAGKDGMGLVELEEYPINRRQKVAKLTRKGRVLADTIHYILSQGETPNDGTKS